MLLQIISFRFTSNFTGYKSPSYYYIIQQKKVQDWNSMELLCQQSKKSALAKIFRVHLRVGYYGAQLMLQNKIYWRTTGTQSNNCSAVKLLSSIDLYQTFFGSFTFFKSSLNDCRNLLCFFNPWTQVLFSLCLLPRHFGSKDGVSIFCGVF